MTRYSSTARLFRYVRNSYKESYRAFALRIGVHPTTLFRYENGQKCPSSATLHRLVAVSGTDSIEALVQKVYS